MKIKTKSGFSCNINENKVKDWRFVKALAKCDSKDETTAIEGLAFIVPFLFGEDGEAKLIEHVSDKDGVASSEAIVAELKEVMYLIGDQLKKSKSSQG